MISTPRFNWVHVPKTGGWWIITLLEGCTPWRIDRSRPHGRLSDLPPAVEARPSFFVVRNPWDWHASFWAFTRKNAIARTGRFSRPPPWDAELRWFYGYGTANFADGVRRMASERPLSWWVARLAVRRDGTRAEPLRFERLREETRRALGQVMDLSPKLTAAIGSSPPVNTTPHRECEWTRGLIDMVGDRERDLVTEFGYAPPHGT